MKGPSGCGRWAVVFEWIWLDQRQAISPEKIWWRVEDKWSGPKGHGWVGDEWSGLKGCGWSVRQAIGLEMMWWRQEMSSGDWMDIQCADGLGHYQWSMQDNCWHHPTSRWVSANRRKHHTIEVPSPLHLGEAELHSSNCLRGSGRISDFCGTDDQIISDKAYLIRKERVPNDCCIRIYRLLISRPDHSSHGRQHHHTSDRWIELLQSLHCIVT